jgi:hypothetical protein
VAAEAAQPCCAAFVQDVCAAMLLCIDNINNRHTKSQSAEEVTEEVALVTQHTSAYVSMRQRTWEKVAKEVALVTRALACAAAASAKNRELLAGMRDSVCDAVERAGMLPYAAVCCRMLPYAAVCCRMLPYAAVCCRVLRYADVC